MDDKELGIIRSTFLGIEDHGIFTFVLHFDFGGHIQGFGTYTLGTRREQPRDRQNDFAGQCIMRILEAVGVDSWEQLSGNEMWVIRRDGLIRGIEAPKYRKTAGRPFDIQELAKKYEEGVKR